MTFYNENDAYAAAWLRRLIEAGHRAAGTVDERSIVDLEPKDLAGYDTCHFFAGIGGWPLALRLADWPDIPVWTGSCPCQPFSVAGKRGGHRDERHLWPAWFRLIRECRPAIVFGEQVASADGLEWLDAVSADMEGEGYAFGAADLCSAGAANLHVRQRLWWCAHTDELRRERLVTQPRTRCEARTRKQLEGLVQEQIRLSVPAGRYRALADAVPNRGARLRAYGNAIDPEVAAEFVSALMETKAAE